MEMEKEIEHGVVYAVRPYNPNMNQDHIKKIRRRIEDRLRKEADDNTILQIARKLGVKTEV